MRLIDADILKAEFTGNFQREYLAAQIKALIDTVPTVDAEPVKHGEWVLGEFDIPHCSECGEKMLEFAVSKYCPFCGAKMDLEE